MRSHLTYANVMATVAVFIALGGSSYAALKLTGKDIVNSSLTGADIRKNSITASDIKADAINSDDVKDRSLRARDFRLGELPSGPTGAAGARGLPGAAGASGATGPAGPAGSDAQFSGAAAGGDLTGTYPDPAIKPDAVAGADVADDTLTGDDIDESTLGTVPSATNANSLGGTAAGNFLQLFSFGTGTIGLRPYSYFMNTSSVNDYVIGQVKIHTTGTPGQFEVCGNGGGIGTWDFVVYLNGTRSTGTVASAGGCSQIFDPGAGGDFEVRIRRAIIFGVHSGDSTTNENYTIYGFSQL